jgi:hypothetical protein
MRSVLPPVLSRSLTALLLLVLSLPCGCSGKETEASTPTDPPSEGGEVAPDREPSERWDGPEVAAALEAGDLVVRIEVPTGGYALTTRSVDLESSPPRVELELVHPEDGAIVSQAFVTLEETIPFSAIPTDPIVVAIARSVRGRHYIQAPPAVVVTEVAPPR